MKLRIENGVLYGDIPTGEWGGNLEHEERLIDLIVPEGVTEIHDNAFFSDPWIRKVVIPGTVRVIGKEAFAACSNLKTLIIEEGVQRIEADAFRHCCCMHSLSLPRLSLTHIGDRAFEDSRFNQITLPETLEYLGAAAFRYNQNLESVTVPGTVKRIEANTFEHCPLETVILREGVEEIGEAAFAMCTKLAEISFPSTLRKIEKNAFDCAVEYVEDGNVWPKFLLPSRDVVIEDEWFKYVADTFNRYK